MDQLQAHEEVSDTRDAPSMKHLRAPLVHVDSGVDRHFFFHQGKGQVLGEPMLDFSRPSLANPRWTAGPKGWTIAPLILSKISGDAGVQNQRATSFARSLVAVSNPSSAGLWLPLDVIHQSFFSLPVSLISFLKQCPIPSLMRFFNTTKSGCSPSALSSWSKGRTSEPLHPENL
jgi:hypothetical protein